MSENARKPLHSDTTVEHEPLNKPFEERTVVNQRIPDSPAEDKGVLDEAFDARTTVGSIRPRELKREPAVFESDARIPALPRPVTQEETYEESQVGPARRGIADRLLSIPFKHFLVAVVVLLLIAAWFGNHLAEPEASAPAVAQPLPKQAPVGTAPAPAAVPERSMNTISEVLEQFDQAYARTQGQARSR